MRTFLTLCVLLQAGCNFFTPIDTVADAGMRDGSAEHDSARDADIEDDLPVADTGSDLIADTGRDADTPDTGRTDASGDGGRDTEVPDAGPGCGNGVVETGEDCEPGETVTSDCQASGFSGGTLRCDPTSCTFDTTDCYDCDYYIAPESGDDDNAGDTPAQAWKSPAVLESLLSGVTGANPGDHICIARGERMEVPDGLDVSRSGTASSPIVVASYGDPGVPRPVLTGSVALPPAGWSDQGNGLFTHPVDVPGSYGADYVWTGDDEYRNRASDATLADGDFFSDGSTVYFKPSGGAISDTVFVDMAGEVLDFSDDGAVEHAVVRGLRFTHGEHAIELEGLATGSTSNVTIRDNVFSHYDDAVRLYAQVQDQLGTRIIRNRFSIVGNGVLASSEDGSHIDIVVADNEFLSTVRSNGSGVSIENAVDGIFSGNVIARGNLVPRDVNSGIHLYTDGPTGTVSGNQIVQNFITGFGDGIFLDPGPDANTTVVSNVVGHNILLRNEDQITAEGCDIAGGTAIVHNTLVDASDDSIQFPSGCAVTVHNNWSVLGSGDAHIQFVDHPDGVAVVQDVVDYNLYVPGDGARWAKIPAALTFAEWQMAGYDTSAVTAATANFVSAVPQGPQDYIPASGYVAIDSGTDLGLATDFGGRPRLQGNGVDIGAWERQPDDP